MTAPHQATAKMLIAHFARVLGHSATNKMSPSALATCLNPVLFPEENNLNAFAQGSKDRCLWILITQRQDLFSGLPVLDNANNPYRNPRLSSSTGGFEDDDDDPPYRKSQESVKLPQTQSTEKPRRPSLAVPTGSGLALDTVNLAFPPRSTSFQASSGEPTPVVYSSPGYAGVRGTRTPAELSLTGAYSAPMSVTQSRSSQVSSASATGSEAFQSSPDFRKNTSELRPVNLSQSASSTSSESAPRRTLSQRAKVGSAQIAHAVKNIARSRSGSSSQSTQTSLTPAHTLHPLPAGAGGHAALLYSPPPAWQHPPGAVSPLREAHAMEFGSPTSSGDSHQPVPPLQTSRPPSTDPSASKLRSVQGLHTVEDGLPAGAALLVARPASAAASSPPSNLPTPDAHLLGQLDNPLFAEPQFLQSVPQIDPDAVFADYHKQEAAAGKKRASTD